MEELKKRSDRNQTLYNSIDQEIEKIDRKNGNDEFLTTQSKLVQIDSELFSDDKSSSDKKSHKRETESKEKNKKVIITCIITFLILALCIILAVVIANGK